MRLSEAMMLGDGLRKRDYKFYLKTIGGEVCGCAIGGAVLACGWSEDGLEFRTLWPWLNGSPDNGSTDNRFSWAGEIGMARDSHPSFKRVMEGDGTFEQLVDYVRSIEPSCGTCNEFSCTCQPATECADEATAPDAAFNRKGA